MTRTPRAVGVTSHESSEAGPQAGPGWGHGIVDGADGFKLKLSLAARDYHTSH